ncbi:PBP1A family penicillin-binding protein [Bacillus sp. WMMC1349]|uniref:transglycosylase domain-containing protein n=1 Tax=Bacillus sp. WMMC1349 TaxID=2736254 RepID=UPI001557743A|nr:PBP1A family penicillin-binding protein [Bacillus sp. WMMC1349]NPC92835.1 PBP1A family penicillin-binding protein [Bacillus sp. WMMC1349]
MSDQFNSRQERRKAQQGKSRSNTQSKPKKKKKMGLFKKILLSILIIGVLGLIAGGATFAFMIADAPSLDEGKLKTPYSSTIYDINGKKIGEIGSEKRKYVPIKNIPNVVKNAFLATEDARFYDHHGVDPIRIGGALIANFQGGFGSEGGSTITQQVVKNSFLSHDKTMKRKVQEVWLSFQLERKYSKDEILEMYLNRIFFSSQAYGVGKAAELFYGAKDLNDLTISQAATLAGMPQSPNNYNPIKHPDRAEKRRNVVLNLMKQNGFISEADYNKAKKVSVKKGLVSPEKYAKSAGNKKYSAFIEQVVEEVQEKTNVNPLTDGLKIHTTIDTKAQDYVDEMMDGNSVPYTEKMKAGLVLLDTKTGEVRAIGGGRNRPAGGFNYATNLERQPGSTIKPVLDYGPVIEHKKWSTYEQIKDEPYHYSTGQEINNYDHKHKGWITMRQALADSRNIPALKAFQAAEKKNVAQFAKGLGLSIPEEKLYEAYAIGGFGNGVSPLQMAGAYSAFGNNGYYNAPHFVTSVEFNDGTKLDLKPEAKAAMSDYTAFMMTDMLKTAVNSGTGTRAQVPGVTVAGKTGTTNFDEAAVKKYGISRDGAKDSWFVGYTPQYTAAVWTGKEGRNSLNQSEQQIAKMLFQKVISKVDDGSGSFKKPDSVVEATVLKGSNPAALASSNAPADKKLTEYFVKGTEPTTVSNKYEEKEDDVKKPSGLSAHYDKQSNSIKVTWSYSGDDDDASFKVTQSVDGGGSSEIQNSSQTEAVISNVKQGSTYRFEVTAVTDDGESSPAAVTLKVTAGDEDQEDDSKDEQDQKKQEDDQKKIEEDKNKKDDQSTKQPDQQQQNPGDNSDQQNPPDKNKDKVDGRKEEPGSEPTDGSPSDDNKKDTGDSSGD